MGQGRLKYGTRNLSGFCFDVAFNEMDEFFFKIFCFAYRRDLSVGINNGFCCLTASGKRDPNIGMLTLTRAVNNASHDSDL